MLREVVLLILENLSVCLLCLSTVKRTSNSDVFGDLSGYKMNCCSGDEKTGQGTFADIASEIVALVNIGVEGFDYRFVGRFYKEHSKIWTSRVPLAFVKFDQFLSLISAFGG